MMSKSNFEIGDIVKFIAKEWADNTGIVSQPISEASPGHVLVHKDGFILGVTAARDEVVPADKSSAGYVQLAYNLIKLGSHVIEQGLL
jgi:hypothetical protein